MSEGLIYWRAMQAFGAALREGRFVLQVDAADGSAQFYPRPVNLLQADAEMQWRPASGRGVLMACTVVRAGAGLPRKPPYLFGLVQLAEGPRVLAIIDGDVAAPPAIGAAVVANVDAAAQPPLSFAPVQQ